MSARHLAQLNLAKLAYPLDSPLLEDFVAGLPVINALAESSPGFVWRLTDEHGHDATGLRYFGDDVIVNLTVWESVEALRGFAYRTAHLDFLRRRREWFVPFGGPYSALWWVPAGHRPTLAEAGDRLDLVRERGSTPDAFTLREPHPALSRS
jgi:hypothetical protein